MDVAISSPHRASITQHGRGNESGGSAAGSKTAGETGMQGFKPETGTMLGARIGSFPCRKQGAHPRMAWIYC